MSTSYWDGPLLSPLLIRMSNPLKRARSTESLERALKRSKPFEPKSTVKESNNNLYPVIKSVSISTKTPVSEYEKVNQVLHSIHVERFGDPEERESWWEDDVEMEEVNDYYQTNNFILRQAFLERQMHK
ncbi:hypothetical protein RO3G_01879 [Rhizopus delemar RA 99-880]|uniref:Uncharacterized protein n=1 Tax=Rhizopus delemar (strain RA 99-880 / ATCC MYA-4621 / FGSC 9543 / NRRL 43880) TaxID=246409 RepID=I1BLU5_RHIO9|nr:hypothetical protein RO3G_01879 [Rhizopus delemar RA 99-880]|eukprot:EIE77175.1 hypothetical protein RO3G_01879 [Rhizopus delemar RA 99-880]